MTVLSYTKKGASLLIAVLIMSAALIIISFTSITQSIGDIDSSFSYAKGGEALWIADGCIEETLRRIRMNTSYGIGAGTMTLSISNGSCTIQVTDLGASNREIVSIGTSGEATRQITVRFVLTGTAITISSWKES